MQLLGELQCEKESANLQGLGIDWIAPEFVIFLLSPSLDKNINGFFFDLT